MHHQEKNRFYHADPSADEICIMLKPIGAFILVFLSTLSTSMSTGDDSSCAPVPSSIVKIDTWYLPENRNYEVEVEFPKFYKSLRFQTLTLKINTRQSDGGKVQLVADLEIDDSDLFNDEREFLVKAVDLIDEDGNYLVDTVELINRDASYLVETSELLYKDGNYLIDIAHLIDENGDYLTEVAELIYEDRYYLIGPLDLPLENENRNLSSFFIVSNYDDDDVVLKAVYSETCTSVVEIALDMDKVVDVKSVEDKEVVKTEQDKSFTLTPTSTIRNYSFEHGQSIGEFYSGSLGSYSVNFPEPDELYNEYEKATITMRKKSGVDYPIDKIEVSIHDYQCETIPSTFFKFEAHPTEIIHLPHSFSVTEPGCIELQFHTLTSPSGESMLVDKFQIMLSK